MKHLTDDETRIARDGEHVRVRMTAMDAKPASTLTQDEAIELDNARRESFNARHRADLADAWRGGPQPALPSWADRPPAWASAQPASVPMLDKVKSDAEDARNRVFHEQRERLANAWRS